MGATVVTGKTVAAFRNPNNGEVIYIAFEQTYEKNCYPHTPSWSPCAIGNFEQVMSRVFASAAACEGGGLQIRSGQTKPETYLKSWRLCFAEPFEMADLEITIKLGGTSMYDTIPDSQVESAIAALNAIGRQDLVTKLQAGAVKLSLHQDISAIIALYGVHTNLPLWKVIDGLQGLGYANEFLAPPIAKRAVAMPSFAVFGVDNHTVAASVNGGPLKYMGWQYSAVGEFMLDVVFPIEMQCSFSAYKLIREFRDACEAAPEMPDDTIITITPAKTEHSYYLERAKKAAVELGLYASADEVPDCFETTFGVVRELRADNLLSFLDDEQVAFTLAPSANSTVLPGHAADGQLQQQSLF